MGVYSPGLGATYPTLELGATDAYNAWAATVKAKGGVVTVMPAPPGSPKNLKTPPAARYPKPGGGWTYELAPASLVAADVLKNYKDAATIALGKAAAVGENVAQAIVDAPKTAFAAVTGLPRWLFPVVLGVGGLLLVSSKLGIDLKGVGRRFAKNPRGRRRRRSSLGLSRPRRRRRSRA